jgi:hypothetical protein
MFGEDSGQLSGRLAKHRSPRSSSGSIEKQDLRQARAGHRAGAESAEDAVFGGGLEPAAEWADRDVRRTVRGTGEGSIGSAGVEVREAADVS